MIRDAVLSDLPALVGLEERCFEIDRLSARSLRRFLTGGKATIVVDAEGDWLRGYVLVLFHPNTSLARLYSIAVDPALRGRGLGRRLVEEAESRALARGATRMRLEVHPNNVSAQKLYRELGYRTFAVQPDFYEDHAEALRMEKHLAPHLAQDLTRVPFYAQSLDFTCGPASMMMAMAAQDFSMDLDRMLEIELWRESTTIFMTAGHGGCGPLGLALAARQRGFTVEAALSDNTEMFLDSVRSEEKKEVIRLVEDGFRAKARAARIPMRNTPFTPAELCRHLARGRIPILMISSYRLTGDRTPHWVVLTACDERFIYINDPYVDPEENRHDTDCIGIPIAPDELSRMMRFGKRKHFAAVTVGPRAED